MPAQSSKFLQSTTQQYLEIYDVTNDLIILKDGSVAMVIQTNAMNFGLLSEEEQDATIYTYAGLLNSLSFPIEIVIRSQKKNVTNYLNYLKSQEQTITNPVRKTQIKRYHEFVESLVQETNILEKKFYIVIPISAIELGVGNASPILSLPTKSKKEENKPLDKIYILDKAKVNLDPKRDHLIAQLARIGLVGRQLNTQELIQLLYAIYNPEATSDQVMGNSRDYTMPVVEASMQGMAKQPSLQSFTPESPQQPVQTQAPVQNTVPVPQVQPEPTAIVRENTSIQSPSPQPSNTVNITAPLASPTVLSTPPQIPIMTPVEVFSSAPKDTH